MTVEQAAAEIMQSHRAPHIVRELHEAMERERAAREAFYDKIQPHDKWEFINGEIVMHSPARDKHNKIHTRLTHLLLTILDGNVEGELRYEKALVSFERNDYEPDICYYGAEKAEKLDPEIWKYPIPNLIIEILSPSTEHIDRGVKFSDYESHGVDEYWIVDPDRETIEQYLLSDNKYSLEFKGTEGIITSRVLGGMRLPVRAAFDDDERRKAMKSIAPS